MPLADINPCWYISKVWRVRLADINQFIVACSFEQWSKVFLSRPSWKVTACQQYESPSNVRWPCNASDCLPRVKIATIYRSFFFSIYSARLDRAHLHVGLYCIHTCNVASVLAFLQHFVVGHNLLFFVSLQSVLSPGVFVSYSLVALLIRST